jgi:hypothetical protein
MINITKNDLIEYIQIRRNAINEILKIGVTPGILDSIEIIELKAVLAEFETIEDWFHE